MSQSPQTPSRGRQDGRLEAHFLAAMALVMLAMTAIGLVGYGSFALQRYLARKAAQEQLAVVSALKVKQIQAWIEHEKSAALGLSRGMLVSRSLEGWLAGGAIPEADRSRALETLKGVQGVFGYRDVGLLSIDGKPLLSSTGLMDVVERYDNWVLVDALLTGKPQLTSVRWDTDNAGGTVHLDVLAPMLGRSEGREQVIAILRLRINPRRSLFPLVQDWPIPTGTAETLLTGVQGADVVFLNELRQREGSALRLVVPMNDPDLVVSSVARGTVDVPLEGLDHLGHRVLGVGRVIPGTQWHVIAKQDLDEIFKDLRSRTLLTSLTALVFVTVAALSVRFWMKQRMAAQIQAELENQANTDRLTGLANRRLLDTHVGKELRRMLRHARGGTKGNLLAVVVIDVDHFKRYNDTYGHNAGDVCLRAVAEAIQGCIARPGDLACRFGGEEFVLVLPETDEEGALVVAESVRSRVEQLARPHASSPVAGVVTVSAGAAAVEVGNGLQIEQLIELGDRALYEAKQRGRNRVLGYSSVA